jgi:hypothetical protein
MGNKHGKEWSGDRYNAIHIHKNERHFERSLVSTNMFNFVTLPFSRNIVKFYLYALWLFWVMVHIPDNACRHRAPRQGYTVPSAYIRG